MSILSGLESLGLGDISSIDLYEEEQQIETEKKKVEPTVKKPERRYTSEKDFVFGKKYVCPVCDQEFKNLTVRSNKVRMLGMDTDLRPRYDPVDSLKYDVVCCPQCGFASLTRYFDQLTYPQAKLIRENISKSFQGLKQEEMLTYDEALIRYQLALANAVVKRARASEKAYICLKMAWLVRGKIDSFDFDMNSQNAGIYSAREEEKEYLKNALDGFVNAMQNERPPICGMDTPTTDYLIGALAYECGEIETSAKMVGLVLQSNSANRRTKDMARELKGKVVEELKRNI